jgi:hypothetical protein
MAFVLFSGVSYLLSKDIQKTCHNNQTHQDNPVGSFKKYFKSMLYLFIFDTGSCKPTQV